MESMNMKLFAAVMVMLMTVSVVAAQEASAPAPAPASDAGVFVPTAVASLVALLMGFLF
ncbi:putative arabinogalactan protein/13/14/21 [Helianthus annuus]|uniref:Arabinogalactan protein 1/12/13/14/21 n=1 Tax=Helianthus annuus TaxID=4232 RepID=A0A251VAZ3_HELAN|nr:putative arabinogalactan protein 1/12/13/14/21 [Helianthus annuus]KAJ0518939.1 putative arabinogalactan protein/13/14/21 [Helianthus annuus]KAJ0816478.1 putative arabinogalactan protein/13/14/21 [Helianthus annuus]